jgi:hypothetical protein
MKTIVKFFLILWIPFSFSCSKDDNGEELVKDGTYNISELAGTWNATKAQFSVSSTSVDVVQDGGTAVMTVQSSGRFTLTLNPADRAAYTVSGEFFWEKWEGSYYLAIVWADEPNDWDTYGDTYDGNTLTLNGGTDSGEYDFDNDGDMESCSIHFIFERS